MLKVANYWPEIVIYEAYTDKMQRIKQEIYFYMIWLLLYKWYLGER